MGKSSPDAARDGDLSWPAHRGRAVIATGLQKSKPHPQSFESSQCLQPIDQHGTPRKPRTRKLARVSFRSETWLHTPN